MFGKLNASIIKEIENIIGKENIIEEKEKLVDYSHDEFSLTDIQHEPEIVITPTSSIKISEIMKIASKEKIPVTTRGGGTGLCGGCVPAYGGIVLSTEKMKNIVEIDEENLMVTLEAGVTLKEFYSEIKKKKLFFPPHPGEESATIGGIISTNAGGARAVKYGTIRNFVRGIEIVLASGKIIKAGGKIIKDSTGYSLVNLFTGSEGTLGIITQATFSVLPEPDSFITLLVPFLSIVDALATVPLILKSSIKPLAIEFISRKIVSIAEQHCGKNWPSLPGEIFLMIILEGMKQEIEKHCEIVAEKCLEKGAIDVFIAQLMEKQEEILHVRSMVYEALKPVTVEILDVSLPPGKMVEHILFVEEISKKYNVWLPTYGHAGDGNLHTHIMKITLDGSSVNNWKDTFKEIRKDIIADAIHRGGKISGEHGIGLVKKEYLEMCLGADYVELLKAIKKTFDPFFILNPGKIFDPT